MDWEDGRKEYVLNETGRVYVGGAKKPQGRPWNFGQVKYNESHFSHACHCACYRNYHCDIIVIRDFSVDWSE